MKLFVAITLYTPACLCLPWAHNPRAVIVATYMYCKYVSSVFASFSQGETVFNEMPVGEPVGEMDDSIIIRAKYVFDLFACYSSNDSNLFMKSLFLCLEKFWHSDIM